ncbi:hypothetical protein, partial [Streptomyces sp. NPDC004976]
RTGEAAAPGGRCDRAGVRRLRARRRQFAPLIASITATAWSPVGRVQVIVDTLVLVLVLVPVVGLDVGWRVVPIASRCCSGWNPAAHASRVPG